MKQTVRRAGHEADFSIESAGTNADEGADIWFKSKAAMDAHGVRWEHRCARYVTEEDYGKWDLILVMDYQNLRDTLEIFGDDPENKVRLLGGRDAISDPYFHGDFEKTFKEISDACLALLKEFYP